MLKRYLTVLPHLIPTTEFITPAILHTDLHMGNIFVHSAENPTITAIIDWQGIELQPLYIAARYPRIIDYDLGEEGPTNLNLPTLPEGYKDMNEEQKMDARSIRDAKMVKKYWLLHSLKSNQRLGRVFHKLPHRLLRVSLYHNSSSTWGGDIALLRRDLIEVANLWQIFAEGHCPIYFSQEELELHESEMSAYKAMEESIELLKLTLGVSEDGWVSRDRYNAASQANEDWKRLYLDCVSKGEEPELDGRWWPFSDRDE